MTKHLEKAERKIGGKALKESDYLDIFEKVCDWEIYQEWVQFFKENKAISAISSTVDYANFIVRDFLPYDSLQLNEIWQGLF